MHHANFKKQRESSITSERKKPTDQTSEAISAAFKALQDKIVEL